MSLLIGVKIMNKLTISLIIISILLSGVGGFILGAQNPQMAPTINIANNTTDTSYYATSKYSNTTKKCNNTKKTTQEVEPTPEPTPPTPTPPGQPSK